MNDELCQSVDRTLLLMRDVLHEREWDPVKQDYTGRDLYAEVTYVLSADMARRFGAPLGQGWLVLAIRNGIKLKAIANTIHAYPTMSLGNRRAADDWMLQKRTPHLVQWIQRVFFYRGRVVKL